ncbi:MAG: rod shape-determining protein MreD [Marinilabiliaceae bacterium]|nr:rod shape-determining protein MreD [Marinilabiliaceae bacterium]
MNINYLSKYLFSFILYVLLFQALIISNINFGVYITPYIYILFILILPIEIAGILLLLLCLLTGLTIDMFQNSPGVHASATLFLGFMRPFILKSIAPRDGFEPGISPTPAYLGFAWFFKYVIICTILHHIFLFMVEAFSFVNIGNTLINMVLSSIATVCFIMIIRLFASSNKKRK